MSKSIAFGNKEHTKSQKKKKKKKQEKKGKDGRIE